MQGFDLSTASEIYLGGNLVDSLWLGSSKIWPIHDYSQDYFTVVSLEDNNEIYTDNNNTTGTDLTLYVKINNGNWDSKTVISDGTTPVTLGTLNRGDKLLIKGNSAVKYVINGRKQFNVEGNIMSLIYSDNFIGVYTLVHIGEFVKLFNSSTNLINAQNLVLPATILIDSCYERMFYNCTSLITAPELPATTLAEKCYYNMFSGCISLTSAPQLSATRLNKQCYQSMFAACISLTSAPQLPATTLAEQCYASMFYNCTSLTIAPELSATALANYCYESMFLGCTSLTTTPELQALILTKGCYMSMFQNCTNLINITQLPARTLTDYCYSYMFSNCTKLDFVECNATDISAIDCTDHWLSGVSATGTFVKNANMTNWTTGTAGIPSGWTVIDA